MPAQNIFCCYALEDERLLNKLKLHLNPLQRQGLIDIWHDRDIAPGTEREREIRHHLNEADIILLLVSPDFLASDICYSTQMQRALERHEQGEARVIPIILRPSDWQKTPFGHLEILPKGGRAITGWRNRDQAFDEVVTEISQLVGGSEQQALFDADKMERDRHLPLSNRRCNGCGTVLSDYDDICPTCGASIYYPFEDFRPTIKVEGSDAKEVQMVALALMEQANRVAQEKHRSPWTSYLLYLIVFMILLVALIIAGLVLPIYAFSTVLVGGILAFSILGALQLRQEKRFKEKGFLKLMALSFKYLPWLVRRDMKPNESSISKPSDTPSN